MRSSGVTVRRLRDEQHSRWLWGSVALLTKEVSGIRATTSRCVVQSVVVESTQTQHINAILSFFNILLHVSVIHFDILDFSKEFYG
jgi:hypothetical protein